MEKPRGIRTWRLGVAFFLGFGAALSMLEGFYVSNVNRGTPPKLVVYLVPLGWFLAVLAVAYGPVARYYLKRK